MVQMEHLLMAIQHQTDTVSVSGLSPLDEKAFQSHIAHKMNDDDDSFVLYLSCSGFLHDIDVQSSEEVPQGLHARGQPVVFRREVLLYHTL